MTAHPYVQQIGLEFSSELIHQSEELPMKKQTLWFAGIIAFVALILNFQFALAHESITVGDYTLEIGWLNEPPVAGQNNAIVVHVSTTSDDQPVEDVSSLTLTISYGGQNKTLTLEPVDEHSPGEFMAPVVPTVPGQYTVQFGGRIGETTFADVQVEPEEVQPADTLAFPNVASEDQSASLGVMNWLIYLSLLIGLIALGVAVTALRKSRG
jgi:hypothetical protein